MTRTLLVLLVVLAGCSKPAQFTAEEVANWKKGQRNFYELPEGTDPNDLEWIERSKPFFVDAQGTRYTIDEIPGMGKGLGIEMSVHGMPDKMPDPPKRNELPPEVLAECERQGIEILTRYLFG